MGDIEKILDKMENEISKYADDGNYKDTYALFRIGDIEQLVDTLRMLNFKTKDLQLKINKVKKILNADTYIENIYFALYNLFNEDYQFKIDNEELNNILKGGE